MDANITTNSNNKPSLIIWLILGLIFALIALNGCTPKITTVYVDRWHVRDSIQYDSVYVNKTDSFFTEKKGDSVFITKIKYLDRFKYKLKYINKSDTIRETKTIEKKVVEYKIKKTYDFIWYLGIFSIIFVFVKTVILIKRYFS